MVQHVNTRCSLWSYISEGEEVHGLRDLVGEAEEVVEAEQRRVTKEER